jgi:hypothetical protein
MRLADPTGESAARVGDLAERLMIQAESARREPDVRQRLLGAVVAMSDLARVTPASAGELGFLVGHALFQLNRTADGKASIWLASALKHCPTSGYALMAWLDLAHLAALRDDPKQEWQAIEQAALIAATPKELAEVHGARGLHFERAGDWERACREFQAWSRLPLDEDSLAQAFWHWAIALDQQGEHVAAMAAADAGEARAYTRRPDQLVAMDTETFHCATAADRNYAEGLKFRWLALRTTSLAPFTARQRAQSAFQAVATSPEVGRLRMALWHLRELEIELVASSSRPGQRRQRR